MKFCKDCKYFKPSDFCHHPTNGYNLVSGEIKSKFASYSRSSNKILTNSCGPDAYKILTNGCGPDAYFFIAKNDFTSEPIMKKPWFIWIMKLFGK